MENTQRQDLLNRLRAKASASRKNGERRNIDTMIAQQGLPSLESLGINDEMVKKMCKGGKRPSRVAKQVTEMMSKELGQLTPDVLNQNIAVDASTAKAMHTLADILGIQTTVPTEEVMTEKPSVEKKRRAYVQAPAAEPLE